MNADVRFWHKADMPSCTAHFRFWGKSGHRVLRCICPLMTQSGHRVDTRQAVYNVPIQSWGP